MKNWIKENILYLAWFQALISMLGSLFFSEIMKLPPCVLCWYQRILLYPLVAIIAVGIIRKDKGVPYYVLPLTIIGLFIATYHNLLYWKILPESYAPCAAGISCTTKLIEWFGFVTIPFLSFLSFAIITACMIISLKLNKHEISK